MRIEMSFSLSPLYIPLFSLLCMALRFNNQWTAFLHELYGLYNSFISRGSMSCYISSSSSCYLSSCSLSPLVVPPTLRNMVCISTRSCLPSSCQWLFPYSDFPSAWSLLPPLPSRSFLFFLVVFFPCSLSRVGHSFPLCLIAPSFLFFCSTYSLPAVLIRYNDLCYTDHVLCTVPILTDDTSLDPCVVLSLSARAN